MKRKQQDSIGTSDIDERLVKAVRVTRGPASAPSSTAEAEQDK